MLRMAPCPYAIYDLNSGKHLSTYLNTFLFWKALKYLHKVKCMEVETLPKDT